MLCQSKSSHTTLLLTNSASIDLRAWRSSVAGASSSPSITSAGIASVTGAASRSVASIAPTISDTGRRCIARRITRHTLAALPVMLVA